MARQLPASVLIGALLLLATGAGYLAWSVHAMVVAPAWGTAWDIAVSLFFLIVPIRAVVRRDRSMLWATIGWYGMGPALGVLLLPAAVVALAMTHDAWQVRDAWVLTPVLLPGIGCILWLTPPSRRYFGLYPNIFGPYTATDGSPTNSSQEHPGVKPHPAPDHPS